MAVRADIDHVTVCWIPFLKKPAMPPTQPPIVYVVPPTVTGDIIQIVAQCEGENTDASALGDE